MSSAGQGFILSGHSEAQLQILHHLSGSQSSLFHVEGPHRIWINKSPVHYFSLRLAPNNDTGEASEGKLQNKDDFYVSICENNNSGYR